MRDGPRARPRLALGCAQMFAAAFAVVLLIWTGISRVTLLSVGVASGLTVTSLLWFGRRR